MPTSGGWTLGRFSPEMEWSEMSPLACSPGTTLAANLSVVLLLWSAFSNSPWRWGVPLGHAAWGGRHDGVFPARLGIASGVAGVVVYPFIGLFVLASASLAADWMPVTGEAGIWFWLACSRWEPWPTSPG